MNDGAGGEVTVDRAKTVLQLKCNGPLRQALKILKEDVRNKGKSVEINWQMERSKDRSMEIGKVPIFLQKPTDTSGKFAAPFQDKFL